MDTTLNLLILISGFLGTLVAFGGETWRKADARLLSKVTPRGWLSLFFLCCTLLLSIWREIENERSALEVSAKQARLQERVDEANRQLGLARQQVEKVQKELESVPKAIRAVSITVRANQNTPFPGKLYPGDLMQVAMTCRELFMNTGGLNRIRILTGENRLPGEGTDPLVGILQNPDPAGQECFANVAIYSTKPR